MPPDPAARPRTLAQRLGLLLVLLILPVAAVALPTMVITHFFGQHPTPKSAPSPAPATDTSGLRRELDRRADGLLPTPAPLTPEPIRVSVREPGHVGPRAEKIKAQAAAFRGSVVEGLAAADEKHLFVDLPSGMAGRFRQAVVENTPLDALSNPLPVSGSAKLTRDQVEVFVRAAANDE